MKVSMDSYKKDWRSSESNSPCESTIIQSGKTTISITKDWKQYVIDFPAIDFQFIKEKSVQLACKRSFNQIVPDFAASTYDASLASAINAEFRELLTLELEKVDDRFFEVHDTAEEQIDELDATVHLESSSLLTVVA